MTSTQVAIIGALAVVILLAFGLLVSARRRRHHVLKDKFGPEYDRTVASAGQVSKAEAELEARAKRVAQLHIRDLDSAERQRFAESWRATQQRFVDGPAAAVVEADQLVTEVMGLRGYPMGEFEQRAADVSVDHPVLVENYRMAHTFALSSQAGKASTEDLRQAMVHYRTMFEDLLGVVATEREPEPETKPEPEPELVRT